MRTAVVNFKLPGGGADSLTVEDGIITEFGVSGRYDRTFDLNGHTLIPGAVDVHAHLREPGYEYKETILRATQSAAKGGITRAFAMPNLIPVPDCERNLAAETEIIKRDAVIEIYPFGALTEGEKGERLSDIEGLSKYLKAYSDDGFCVNDLKLLEEGMYRVKAVGGIIASHAERRGAKDSEAAEYEAVAEELELVRRTGVKYHFCHLSTRKSFELVKAAVREGLDVSCEVTPHHLTLNKSMIVNADWKMNPPLRSAEDVRATIDALTEGVATIVATDHAPHSAAEKARPYDKAPNGILGFETMFPAIYTALVATGKLSLDRLSEAATAAPAARFGVGFGKIVRGERAEFIALNTTDYRRYSADEILGTAKNSPYIGMEMTGFNAFTMVGDSVLYKAKDVKEV